MIVVGLDVSLVETGVAVWHDDNTRLHSVKSPGLGAGLAEMSKRIAVCVDGILELVPERFDLLVIERPLPARGKFASLQLERAAAYWILIETLLQYGPVCDVHPKTRAKIATGNGNGNKVDVLREVRKDFAPLPIKNHNVADAVALMGAGLCWLGQPWFVYSQAQQEGFDHIEWPEGTRGEVSRTESKEQA